MIQEKEGLFLLETAHTTYAFCILETGQAEHLYYGRKIHIPSAKALQAKQAFGPGNTIALDQAHRNLTLENVRQEWSGIGKGDTREPFVEIEWADGSSTCDFRFDSFRIDDEKEQNEVLPGAYGDREEHLVLVLKEAARAATLELHYYVYPDCDCITRQARLVNDGGEAFTVKRLMSLQLDLPKGEYDFISFHGAWAREMKKTKMPVREGSLVSDSTMGPSGNGANPFVILAEKGTDNEKGICIGANLIYSGNHMELVQVGRFHGIRLLTGLSPKGFSYLVEPGESFLAPEAVLSVSGKGFNGLSENHHRFVREHIVRGTWKKKERPILLNSWEAAYFDISESRLLKLAKEAADAGMELFVMDDGWFGQRDNDEKSLGDWHENTKKLPNGLAGLAKKINALGLLFGIWVEPEMVNADSDLYRAHPDWALAIPGREQSEGRNQQILNLSRLDVQEFLIEEMTRVFSSAKIDYVKWDMNRIVSDNFAQNLPADRQGEAQYRYYTGLYRVVKTLTERFPEILFEGCASGGNRFDLGMLCYFPQIWASDNTDALCRLEIQNGYSYGYPQSTYSAHVSSCPNHQTLRVTPLETRFAVASFGVLGYECNLCDMKKEELAAIRAQVELYKAWRNVLQFGQLYRGKGFDCATEEFSVLADTDANRMQWTVVSEDKTKAVGGLFRRLAIPNDQEERFVAFGLDEEKQYRFTNRILKYDVRQFGDLINTVAPIHVKQDSAMHNLIAKFVKMEGETEDYLVPGDLLCQAGIGLKQAYAGTGFNEEVRFYQDFGSRMYFMEEEC